MADTATKRRWLIDLPHGDFVTPNSRGHWTQRHSCSKAWREAAGWAAKASRVPALHRAEVTLHVTPGDRRRRDPDGFTLVLKWCVDGLVDAGVLPDDTAEHVAYAGVRMLAPARWGWTVEVKEVVDG